MTQIKELLIEMNPWWKGDFHVDFKERDIHQEIRKYISLKQMISFTGLRRVGKTTLMMKVAEEFIANGFSNKNIIYFSFDESRNAEIRQLIKEYELIMNVDFNKGKYLLLLDEVQKLINWENQLKSVYDNYGKNVKIIFSGSESLFIKKKLKETLAGRMFEFQINTLSFKEFLAFKGIKYMPLELYKKELIKNFNDYILTSGFPEIIDINDKEIVKKYLREGIIEKVIYRDIPQLFKVRDVSIIDSLFNIILYEPGRLVEISELSNELKVSRQTLSSYLTYLEKSFMLKKLYNFSFSRTKVERKLKKYYPTIVPLDLVIKNDELSKSKVFEWAIVNNIKTQFFWRDSSKNEVDAIIIGEDKKPIPLEIKYGKIDYSGLIAFMEKFKVNKGYIISYDKDEKVKVDNKDIFIIPAYKYLLT